MNRNRPDGPTVHRIQLDMDKGRPGEVSCFLIENREPRDREEREKGKVKDSVETEVSGEITLVDAGPEKASDELRRKLGILGCSYEDIDNILVTHPHGDHIGNINRILQEGDPRLYTHESVPEYLNTDEETVRETAREIGLKGEPLEESVGEWTSTLERNRRTLPINEIDVFLGDGDTIQTSGTEFTAVDLPGHQSTHHCYRCGDTFFTGDGLIEAFRPILLGPGFSPGIFDAGFRYVEGLRRLREMDPGYCYPGHGVPFGDVCEVIDETLLKVENTVSRVEEALGRFDSASAGDVAYYLGDDMDELRYWVFESPASLGYLESEDRVSSWMEDGVRRFRTK
ncbi:MAG: MBL fold metallo-hydrolase [Halobacteria archaeon]